jgi:hypothetical protein
MAKQLLIFYVFFLSVFIANGQVKIHSHNDYTHSNPFYEATAEKAFSIEADIYVVGDSLFVAHNKNEIKPGHTLENMYLKPIQNLSKTENFYTFQLMIDFKDPWASTYHVLLKNLNQYQKAFNKQGKKVSVVISGNRPPESTFHNYPPIISFDGLPNINYAPEDLKRVVMISDNFASFSKWKGVGEISEADKAKLEKVINDAHKIGKPFRFWGGPDTEACWDLLHKLGADIINTDQVVKASNYFKEQN